MSIEDVAEKADVWSEAVKKIVKAIMAAVVALVAGISGLMMLWPDGESEPVGVRSEMITGVGYSVQCSQFMNTIDITWTEAQWSVWEQLRKDLGC
jgi:hypothetical protein